MSPVPITTCMDRRVQFSVPMDIPLLEEKTGAHVREIESGQGPIHRVDQSSAQTLTPTCQIHRLPAQMATIITAFVSLPVNLVTAY